MTIPETHKFLNSIKWLDIEIARKQLQHDGLESCLLPKAITYDKDTVQTSPADPMLAIASQVVDLEKQIRQLKAAKAERIVEVNSAIATLDDDAEQLVLLGFYVGRIRALEISEMTHYSISGVYKVRRKAVEHLAAKLGTK